VHGRKYQQIIPVIMQPYLLALVKENSKAVSTSPQDIIEAKRLPAFFELGNICIILKMLE